MTLDEEVSELLGLYAIPPDFRNFTLTYGAFLLKNLRDGAYGEPPDDHATLALLKDYELAELPTRSQLKETFLYLRKNDLVTQCGTLAMLAYLPREGRKYANQHEALQAWSFASSLSLGIHYGETISSIETLTRRVRRIVQDSRQNWVLSYIKGAEAGLNTLIREFDEELIARKSSPPVPGENSNRLEELLVGLTAYQRHLANDQAARRSRKYRSTSSQTPDEEHRVLMDPPEIGDIDIDDSEATNDYPRDSMFVQPKTKVSSPLSVSYPLLFKQAGRAVNQIAINNIAPPCHWSRLSRHEIARFLDVAESWIDDPRFCWLTLLLCTGRRPDKLKDAFLNRQLLRQGKQPKNNDTIGISKTGSPYIATDCKTPPPKGREDWASIYRPTDEKVSLPLPTTLVKGIRYLRNLTPEGIEDIARQAEQLCRDIDSQNRRLTPTRLANYLPAKLRDMGVDSAEIALIVGKQPSDTTALYYYSPTLDSLVKLYQTSLNEILREAGSSLHVNAELSSSYQLGSKSIPKKQVVKVQFAAQLDIIETLKKRRIPDFRKFHNEYMIYVYEALNLCIGYRAVHAPLECITDYDLLRKIVWVSDKENRNGLSARIVPLCQTAIDIIDELLSHLECLSHYTRAFSAPISDFLAKSITGEAPLLSLFGNSGKLGRIEPGRLKPFLAQKWPQPQNWQRHFMRTELRKSGVPGELVNAWMGHSDFGEEAFGPWSGLALADFQDIGKTIEEIVQSLGIKSVSGWGRTW